MAEDEEDQQAPVRRRKPEQAAVPRGFRRCQECKEPLHVASKVCPSCGAKMIPSAKARKRKPDGPASSNAEGSGAGKADKADSSGSEASSADEADSDSDNAAASSSDEEDQNNEEQAQKKERMRESSRAGTYERVVLDRLTSKAKVQPAEGLDLAAFVVKGKRARPMLELRAGSNLWFQATILKESQNEMKVHFPATEDEEEVIEWLRKSSSRIWRGSMATKDWRHLGKGAWQPRAKPKAARGRKGRAARKPGRRPGGARGSLMGETTDTRTGGTGMSVEGSEDSEGQEDVASPRPLVPALGPKQAAGRRSVLDSESESDVDVEGNGESADDQTQDQAGTARQQTHRTAGTSGRQADTAARRQGGSAQQAQPGPLQGLVDWFSCHFSLLQSAGRLGSHPLGTTPECGMVPVKVEVLQSGRVELGQEGGQKAHRQSKLAPPETKAHISKIAGPSKPGLHDGDDSDSDPARKRQKRQAVGPRELNGILSSPFAWEKKRRQAAASSSSAETGAFGPTWER
ncbi:hypothetical protein WJX72_005677 [[Myrmecia] bisecta]|uniref:Uncharacterized protein n=1 Tax=[Myrmecia] bisecta TaxID=41462 RepID=A0AAW1P951_9CHLO